MKGDKDTRNQRERFPAHLGLRGSPDQCEIGRKIIMGFITYLSSSLEILLGRLKANNAI